MEGRVEEEGRLGFEEAWLCVVGDGLGGELVAILRRVLGVPTFEVVVIVGFFVAGGGLLPRLVLLVAEGVVLGDHRGVLFLEPG